MNLEQRNQLKKMFFDRIVVDNMTVRDLYNSLTVSIELNADPVIRTIIFSDILERHKEYYRFHKNGAFLLKIEEIARNYYIDYFNDYIKDIKINKGYKYIESIINYKAIPLILTLFIVECRKVDLITNPYNIGGKANDIIRGSMYRIQKDS